MRRAVSLAAGVTFSLLSWALGASSAQGPPAVAPGVQSAAPAGTAAAAGEVLAEVRVHGNHSTPDSAVLAIAGLTLGQPVNLATIDEVAARLRRSGRFADVDVRKRYRSLTAAADVVIVIVVREHDAASGSDADPTVPPSFGRRLSSSLMFLPVLDYTDGYGFTYGARFTFAGALGRDGRMSVPLTWGGTKRVAVELERPFPRGLVDSLSLSGGWSRRENPHFDVDEERAEVGVAASREVVRGLRAGIRAGLADLTFAGDNDRLVSYGADLTLDTRLDPSFPRNAVLALASWDGTDAREAGRYNRYRAEGHGYLGLIGSSVLAVGTRYEWADRPLPPYAQPLLGGAETLRGFRAGAFASDNLLAASAELRVPFTSPLSVGTTGFALFADTGASYPHGTALGDARFERGFGGGLFLILPIGSARVDVAHAVGGGNRAHVTLGVRF